ncbi:MAG: hypothetical protein ACRD0L_07490 [Acidimicrobiales bacterium]
MTHGTGITVGEMPDDDGGLVRGEPMVTGQVGGAGAKALTGIPPPEVVEVVDGVEVVEVADGPEIVEVADTAGVVRLVRVADGPLAVQAAAARASVIVPAAALARRPSRIPVATLMDPGPAMSFLTLVWPLLQKLRLT